MYSLLASKIEENFNVSLCYDDRNFFIDWTRRASMKGILFGVKKNKLNINHLKLNKQTKLF